VVHPVWATSTREIARSFLYYYLANEGIQPTAKPAVTSSSFSHSLLSQNTIFTLVPSRKYISLIKEGCLLGKKTLT
jgi:hypothetical protein